VTDASTRSYGKGFNNGNGGVYAMEWTDDAIRTWFFPRNTALPASLLAGAPNTDDFGTPAANFKGSCNVKERFKDQRFIFSKSPRPYTTHSIPTEKFITKLCQAHC